MGRRKLLSVFLTLLAFTISAEEVSLKEILRPVDVIENQLIGYGIVVGLAGTGDRSTVASQSVVNMLRKLGITVDTSMLQAKNCAAVVVTATLPPFAKRGDKIDVEVSSIADAKSLQGGYLLMTPLLGADGKVYAVAQGPVSIGGFNAGLAGGGQKNHETSARVPQGAIVQKEVPVKLANKDSITFSVEDKDFETVQKICDKINAKFGLDIAHPLDAGSIKVKIPDFYLDNPVAFVASLLSETVDISPIPTVVINEKTATVVMGGDVKILPAVVTHNQITVRIGNKTNSAFEMKSTTVSDLVKLLNNLNLKARDIIAILQALKAAGVLKAKLKTI